MTDYDPILDEDLSALVDGELSSERAAELKARVEREPALAARLDALRSVGEELRSLPTPEVSPALSSELKRRVALEERDAPAWRGAWVGAAAAIAASLVVYLVLSPGGAGPPEAEPARVATELDEASDEEIGIAIEYETLAELELIEDLDVLELMAEQG